VRCETPSASIGPLLAAALLVGTACGDDAPPTPLPAPDAGPAPLVTPPALPRLLPCPPGWREVPPAVEGGPPTCDPFPEGGPHACGPAQAHFPGAPGCVALGPACPADGFPEEDAFPAGAPVVYVRAGAAPGGDGTRARPLGDVTLAFDAVPAGGVVALSVGTHDGALRATRPIAIVGACAAGTVLRAGPPALAVIGSSAVDLSVRRLTLTGDTVGVVALDAATVSLEDVVIDGVVSYGLYVLDGGVIRGRRVRIDPVRADRDGLRRALTTDVGGGLIELTQAVLDGQREYAGQAYTTGGVLRLVDAHVRNLPPDDPVDLGRCFEARAGGRVELLRTRLDGCTDTAVMVQDGASSGLLEDVIVGDVASDPVTGRYGRALSVQGGGRLEAARVAIARARQIAIYTSGRPTDEPDGVTATLRDVVVADTLPEATGVGGRALQVQWGARVLAERLFVAGARDIAVHVARGEPASDFPETRLDLVDATVRDVAPDAATSARGVGVIANAGAVLRAERMRVVRTRDSGLVLGPGGADVALRDVDVEAIDSGADGRNGTGVAIVDDVTLRAERLRVRDVRVGGVITDGRGGDVVIRGLGVDGVRPAACARSTCPTRGFGVGAGAFAAGASLTLHDFVLAHAELAGLQLAGSGPLELRAGRVVDNEIGVNLQRDGVDFDALSAELVLQRNARNVDARALPVPEPRPPAPLVR
jgi:hypothetical protein